MTLTEGTEGNALIDRLVRAAEQAIRAEEPGLAWDAHRLRGVTLELEIDRLGKVTERTVYITRDARREVVERPIRCRPGRGGAT